MRFLALLVILLGALPIGCAPHPKEGILVPVITLTAAESEAAWTEAQSVFENRCVVCHGCYDAPCQLKLGSYEGITRGATSDQVYDSARLVAATPTRLGTDGHTVDDWRKKGFHSVLADGEQRDPRASLLVRMLALKSAHPLVTGAPLPPGFTLDLDRKQTCTDASHFDKYAKEHPAWGMPYAFPGLDAGRERALLRWVEAGAPKPHEPTIPPAVAKTIAEWEAFLDDPSPKGRLVGRYIFEHLFLASIYFKDHDATTFYRLVRSRTASGIPVDEIATRRPFDDPGVERVHYRFVLRGERPLEKTHMPYPLGVARLRRFHELFFAPEYEVKTLPGYDSSVAANPFRAYRDLPVASRYRFMLDEAEFTMMGFIKGPVCRGQVALNVIEDRFFVYFLRPDARWMKQEADFLAGVKDDLDMPAEAGSTALPTIWLRYASDHDAYVAKRRGFLFDATKDGDGLTSQLIWDGEGTNTNAALTVFRHFDSATVVKGLIGPPPKTAWVVGYPLLERIHYLLVAGFDVFGNVGHQMATRLYMDFLRMEGEADFLMFLPQRRRQELTNFWYRGVTGKAKETVAKELERSPAPSSIEYRSAQPELELFRLFAERTSRVLNHTYDVDRIGETGIKEALEKLSRVKGRAASMMPELSFLTLTKEDGGRIDVSLLRESAHANVAHLFGENARRLPNEDALTVVRGLLGAYPNAFFEVAQRDLAAFVDDVTALPDDAGYRALRARYGVSRTSARFWRFSDALNDAHRQHDGIAAGLFDYSRLDAF